MKNRYLTLRTPACSRVALLACLLSPAAIWATEGSPCGPGMSGAPKTIVFYAPGARVARANELMPEHLAFLKSQMSQGNIQYAGPLVAGGAPTGKAVLIYNSADADIVKAVVQTDPMVMGQVFSYEIGTWLECQRSTGA